jgi:hypothetical protein
MYHCRVLRFLTVPAALALVAMVVAAPELGGLRAQATQAQSQAPPAPQAFLTAQQTADGVRYAVTLLRDPGMALRDVRVEVHLPPGAQFVEGYETPGITRFLGNDRGTLRWAAPEFPPGPYVDAFTFLLRARPPDELAATVRWGGDPAGQAQLRSNPRPIVATAVAGEIVLGSEGTTELVPSEADPNVMVPAANPGGVPVGDTGVLIAVPPGAVPDGTVVRVRKLAPDADPPAAAGDLWWCAMVEVTGLPPGVEAYLYVPPRRPLPPWSDVALFTERDGRWERSERNGSVDFSGQYIWMPTRGGVLAAGQPPGVRNVAVSTTAAGAVATPGVTTSAAPLQRTLPAAPTALAGALPTPTPIAADAQPLSFSTKVNRILTGAAECLATQQFCTNSDGQRVGCSSFETLTCRGGIRQGGLFRRDGYNVCNFTVGPGGTVTEGSCSFVPD